MADAKRLTKDDWLAAGFRALTREGPDGLKAERIAKALGTTKGSFYWHFQNLPAYHAEMLALWKARAATEIITELQRIPDPALRLQALTQSANAPAPDEFGGAAVEPAIRAWAAADANVLDALRDVDAARVRFIADTLNALGQPDPNLALGLYGAFIGLSDIAAKTDPTATTALETLVALILSRSDVS